MITSFILSLCVQRKHELKLTVSCLNNTSTSEIKGKHPLDALVCEILNTISNTESKQPGVWDMWSPDFTCVTLFLSLKLTPDKVSLHVCRRGTEEMEVISLKPPGTLTAKVSLFLSAEKPLNKQRYGSVSISVLHIHPVLFPPLPPSPSPSYLQEQDWTDMLG